MRRLVRTVALCLGVLAAPASAQSVDYCTEAWVLRNMIFDRLGHCFQSVTGQMLFDNVNCTVSGPTPTGLDAETVSLIREGEAFVGCRVSTGQMPTAAMRQTYQRFAGIMDLPAPDYVGGYACWGYRGADFPVRSGAFLGAPIAGMARTGQSVLSTYFGRPGGWVYVEILTGPDGRRLTEGWMRGVDLSAPNCDLVAG